MKAFLDELKRRNVIRVGGIYLVASWVLMQAAALLEDALSLPDWFDTIIVVLILLGFPVVLLFAWLFEVTPQGLRRTPAVDAPEDQASAASTRRRLDLTLIAVIVLAVAVIAADRFLPGSGPTSAVATEGAAASQATAPPTSQRVAFFGFTVEGDDPVAKEIAKAATDETIQGMSANRIETFARSETLGTSPDQRLTRASQIGALYALSGEVQVDGGRIKIATLLEDVPTRTTLWDGRVSDQESETDPLIVQAAAKATEVVSCLVRLRTSLTNDERSLLQLMTKVCDELRQVNPDKLPAVRELARRAPKSAVIQASLAHAASLAYSLAPDASGPALIQEADEALARAAQLDPQGLYLYMARGYVGQAKKFSLIDQKNLLEEGLRISPNSGSEIFPFSMLNFQYGVHLFAVGRAREAEAYMRAATGTDPYGPFKHAQASVVLAAVGKTLEARRRFEETFSRLPTAQVWEMWLMSAIFFGAGNPTEMLDDPPAFISGDAVACWREIAAAVQSPTGPNRLRGAELAARCADNGLVSSTSVVPALAALGATDQALETARTLVPTSFLGDTAVFFWSQTHILRADQRFLPLVEKLGLMDYWRATKTQPDVCATEDAPFCTALKTAAPP